MASNNARQKRRCRKKTTFGSKEAADKAFWSRQKNSVFRFKVYRRPTCQKWHLGRAPRVVKKQWEKLVS